MKPAGLLLLSAELDAQIMSDCLKHHLIPPRHGSHSCLFGLYLQFKSQRLPWSTLQMGSAALPWQCAYPGAALFLSDEKKPPAEAIPPGQWIPVWLLPHRVAPGESFLQDVCSSRPLLVCLAYTSSQFIVMIYSYYLQVKCLGDGHSFLVFPFVIIYQMTFFFCL